MPQQLGDVAILGKKDTDVFDAAGEAQIVVEAICDHWRRHVHVAEVAGRRIAGAGERTQLPEGPMRQRRRVIRIIADHHQTADDVRGGFDGEFATADDRGMALLADPTLEGLQFDEAGKAFVFGAGGPLAVGLHQGSHEFSTSFKSGGAGCPLLTPRPPHASACRGERPYWWEQAQGLNSHG